MKSINLYIFLHIFPLWHRIVSHHVAHLWNWFKSGSMTYLITPYAARQCGLLTFNSIRLISFKHFGQTQKLIDLMRYPSYPPAPPPARGGELVEPHSWGEVFEMRL